MTDTTSKQKPIGTGFTAASTVDDVLAGIDLTGTNVIITGGHTGLGREMTRGLSRAGASVMIAARNPDRAAAAVEGIERVETGRLDLVDPASIDAFAARYRDSGRPLHILINNAGVMGGPLARDARGYEYHFAANHLGHFQLTNGLLPALRAAGGARVVTMTSGAHRLADIRWDDPNFERTDYDGHLAYGQSKTANVLFTVELDRRWSGDGIRGYVVHPGIIATTNLGPARGAGEAPEQPEDWMAMLRAQGLFDDAGNPVIAPEQGLKTPAQGAATAVLAATSPLLAGIGGVYLKDNDISPVDDTPPTTEFDGPPPTDVAPHAIDPESARRLWTLSEQLLEG
ncbi:SDR family NAD(P)-dependent oxidoreductase [Myceligenerans pegani]|uniref:SDR family NAD(P)-dependent oxidoreductase n=1 Tax=Myceligenerans pegani TaxID=2776917 RepID=A0ABR9N606_9MICO|nr:SDR family NAD(P)-dependent oxidoreductase [Myceligenerans sp. TRM 65318]MBE1878452.1 SDR family NAD(P)-dependent oxidoreductase [Myceligenerans sp. TRM 65318]MBE3020723.1 SDR family NAD(P)-dependent oxidoreductase [Myceligenerans sp. TRM 65318]